MEIKLAKIEEVKEVTNLVKECVNHMRSKGIDQWFENYPSEDIIIDDILSNTLYALKYNNELLGVITLNEDQVKEYKAINWKYKQTPILIVHRLAISPNHRGKGYAKKLMDFVEEFAIKNNYKSIRLDAYSINQTAINLYEKRNFNKVGTINFTGREHIFYCYEKKIS